jgi:hypothetical protein
MLEEAAELHCHRLQRRPAAQPVSRYYPSFFILPA